MTGRRYGRAKYGGLRRFLCGVCLLLAVALAGRAVPVHAQNGPVAEAGFATLIADRLFIDGGVRLVAEGNVEALFGTTRLQARRVSYDRTTGALQIDGPLVLNDGRDVIMLADAAQLSDNLQRGLIRSARVVFDEQLQLAAATVERLDARFSEMTAVVASSCEICAERPTPLWEIRARRVVHDEQEKQVHFENAQFRLFGLPVLYVPRLRVPDPRLERATGFLSPSFSVNTGHRLGLRAPYFIVLSADRDLTVTPFVASRGTRALELRYRQAFATGQLELGGLVAQDKIRPGVTRAMGYAFGEFALGQGYMLRFNLIQPSDQRVLEDYGRDQPRLTSEVTVERIRRDTREQVQLLQFRSLRLADVNSQLPNQVGRAALTHRRDVPGLGGVAGLRFEAEILRRGQAHAGTEALPGLIATRPRQLGRLSLDLDWRRDAVLPVGLLGAVGLNLGLDHVRLSQTDGAFPVSQSRVTPQLMAELRWPFVRAAPSGARHVVAPVAQVIWARDRLPGLPHEASRMPELDEGNLFALNRFPGQDQRELGLRGNMGVSWTRLDPDGWSSTVTLGRSWRARDLGQFSAQTPLAGRQSDWVLAGSLDTADGLSLSNRSHFTSDMQLTRTAFELDWATDAYSLSTSYMRIRANPFEARAATASEWSFEGTRHLSDFWTGRVGWRYDIAQSRAAHAMVGLNYQNECLRMEMGLERQFASATRPTSRTSFGLNLDILGIGGNPSRNRRACNAL